MSADGFVQDYSDSLIVLHYVSVQLSILTTAN